jgi:pimeloyl-ACP methyl ester carboxylesterase
MTHNYQTKAPKALLTAILLAIPVVALAQGFKDLQTPESPLVLKSQGSFFVGGEKVDQSEAQVGFGPAGRVTVNQMYVRYMVPPSSDRNAAVVMVHGMTLTGKTWETTPDGRMGWDEYFVRKGHAVYIPDQVARGRSGFNQAVYNDVRAGKAAPDRQPVMRRFSDEVVWPNFRFGPKPGTAYPDEQFPVAAVDELSKQSIPDLNLSLPAANPSHKALAELARQLKNTVLMGHSQGGTFPLEAALIDSTGIRGMVLVEPGTCPAAYTDEQIRMLAKIPILVVFGDHLKDAPTGLRHMEYWQIPFDSCQAFIKRVNGMDGKAQMLFPPDRGIRGNSHMIMQDKNNLQIADLILTWIRTTAGQMK